MKNGNFTDFEIEIAKSLHLPKYFDFAAATPMHPAVIQAMQPFWQEDFYNPSAQYAGGIKAGEALENARTKVAKCIGAKPSEIIFTAGATESISLAINGIMQAGQAVNSSKSVGPKIAISSIEHAAVYETARQFEHVLLPVDQKGQLDLKFLENTLIDPELRLVSIIYANNEIGTVQPISQISQIIKKYNLERRQKGQDTVYLHIDAAQAPLYLDISAKKLGVDLMTLNGGKIYGPKQSGILYRRTGIDLQPQVHGGGQEFGLRSGTENVAFAVGFAEALQRAVSGHAERAKNTAEVRDYLITQAEELFSAELVAGRQNRLANSDMLIFPGCDNERMLIELDMLGFSVSLGSACHASSERETRVLQALGVEQDRADSALRFSINQYTTKEDVDALIAAIKTSISKAKAL